MRTLLGGVLFLAACTGSNGLGGLCETRDDCLVPLQCVTSAPAGFCSRGCTAEGTTTECPANTVCTYFGSSSLVCSTYCTTDADCRINYECKGVVGLTGKLACRPVNVVR